jgi:hypothetical protein
MNMSNAFKAKPLAKPLAVPLALVSGLLGAPTRTAGGVAKLSANLGVVYVWTIAGLILTAIAFALGLGVEIGQSLAAAG